MSYHDRSLLVGRKAKRGASVEVKRKALNGVFSITLWAKPPRFEMGSIDGDWRAVGKDIRKAIKSQEVCD